MPGIFVIERDARGSLVHVRRRDDGECVGCIEVGLYEFVRTLLLEDVGAAQPRSSAAPQETDEPSAAEEEVLSAANSSARIERQSAKYRQGVGVKDGEKASGAR